MGLDNPIHIAFLLVILLLVFGAKRLPEMGRSLGSGLRGFKESINGEHSSEQLPAATTMAVVPASTTMAAVPVATTMTAVSTDEPERDHAGTASAV